MDKKPNKMLCIAADFLYVLGTFIAWYTTFFIYGRFTAMFETGSIADAARRTMVASVFAIAAVLYCVVTIFYVKKRKSKNLAFWFGCLHGFIMVVTALMLIIFPVGSEVFLWLLLLVAYYPIIAIVMVIVYIFIYVYKYITKERPVDRLR